MPSPAEPLMNAVQIDAWGGPEQLIQRRVPRPVPGPGQVLVRVRAAALNAVDRRVRQGYMDGQLSLPYTGGSDFSGVVEAAGDGADLPPGTAVFGALWPTSGAYAEYTVFDAADLARKPEGLGFDEAAALPVAGITARVAVLDDGRVRQGQRVLVQGAAGGVGHLGVQLAKMQGAHVIATASPANYDFVRALGADEVIDYHEPGWAARLDGLDLVIDGVSAASLSALYPAIRPGGLAISLFDPPVPPPGGFEARLVGTLAVARQPLRAPLEALARLVTEGTLRVEVTAAYRLSEIAAAQETSVRGKAVVRP
ncbi:NADP-dependent oxidoreductase [Actinacidiphila sp. bgisy144]|uniref:NADP-dependent oxidoreductase n=1 Tax=Actinacidiphila sp. bgisy144 TaxID=3413791 RepID=UPI003EBC4090